MDSINLRFLFFGYSAALIILLGFILLLVRRGKRIDHELERLKTLAEDAEKRDAEKRSRV
jgi:CcmD family protein